MSLPTWIEPTGVPILASAFAWIMAWRVSSAKFETQVQADTKRSNELREADEKRADELREADARRANELHEATLKQSEELKCELKELKSAWTSGIDRVQDLAENIASLQGSQNQVNAYTARALDSLSDKVEQHGSILADHTSTIRLLVDRVMMKKEGASA